MEGIVLHIIDPPIDVEGVVTTHFICCYMIKVAYLLLGIN